MVQGFYIWSFAGFEPLHERFKSSLNDVIVQDVAKHDICNCLPDVDLVKIKSICPIDATNVTVS
jgi:hypothetical protein